MTTEALDIYSNTLSEQLGEDGVFTEAAIYDPDGVATTIYGIYENNEKRGDKDGGNSLQKKKIKRFIVASLLDFDIYDDKQLKIVSENETYKIQYVDKDDQGARVIWLV